MPRPDIDMIGAQDIEDEMQLHIGHGHVIYTGGAKGTDALAEEMAKQFGMQVEVLVPPNHPRAQYVSPSTVEVLVLANPHLHQAAHKLCKKKFTCLIFPVKLGTGLKTTTTSTTIRLLWSLAASSYPGVSNPPPFIKAVLWLVPEIWTRKPERKSKPYSTVPSVYPRTLNNYEWN